MPQADHDALIERLIAEMTIEEKAGQLTMTTAEMAETGPGASAISRDAVRQGRIGSILNLFGPEPVREAQRLAVEESRLKIPLFFGLDVVHGHRTIFPVPLAESCAFDQDLWERTARIAAEEAAADGIDLTFAPMLDVTRDPRWGRIVEGTGEDPYLAQCFARAKVRGFQSPGLSAADAVAATAKHLAAYGAVTGGREYNSAEISERQLHEIYLPPFRAAVAAGSGAIMPSLTDIAGIPMTGNVAILNDLLRGSWGFKGVIISDYGAVAQLVEHGVAADLAEATALGLKAGTDIDMMGQCYMRGLAEALARGLLGIDLVDAAVRRVLAFKAELGLFDNPYRRVGAAKPSSARTAERRSLAREAACRSIVLLENRDGALPIAAQGGPIAVIGPLGRLRGEMLGPWSSAGSGQDVVPLLEGLSLAFPDREVAFAEGSHVGAEDPAGLAEALALARRSEVAILTLGETPDMSGEASSRGRPILPEAQAKLAQAVIATGKPAIVFLLSGRPLILPDWLCRDAKALLAASFLGIEAGHALGDVLSGRCDATGRLTISWPVDVGQIPIYYSRRTTGRPTNPKDHFTSKYLDLPVGPLFPFGRGLSYAAFRLTGLATDRAELRPGDSVEIAAHLVNDGARAGEETLFLFTSDRAASVARPTHELKRFGKIRLAGGESGTLRFTLAYEDFAFLGQDLQPRIEAGPVELLVGRDAELTTMLRSVIRLDIASA